jgi:serine/threonine-protein kinase
MISTCIPLAQPLLDNRYEVLRLLEDGPWSMAWLAEDTRLPSRRQCIIRQVKPLITDPQMQQQLCDRIQVEVRTWQKLGGIHNQIPWLSSFADAKGQIYLLEEWIPGVTLTQKLQANGSLDEATVQDILIQLLSLVDYLHQNQVVHCVLEPNHILLRAEDNKPVLQYGGIFNQVIAQIFLENDIRPIPWITTSGYLPHEQVILNRHYYSSNLYSLGLIGIYLLTGKPPHRLFNLTTGQCDWYPQIPMPDSAFAAILNKAIARFPGERFVTARQMLIALATPRRFVQPSLTAHANFIQQMGAYFSSRWFSLPSSEPTFNSYSN